MQAAPTRTKLAFGDSKSPPLQSFQAFPPVCGSLSPLPFFPSVIFGHILCS